MTPAGPTAILGGLDERGELDPEALRVAYVRHVADHCPSTMPLAVSLWERIGPRQWTLEWHLPRWLGDSLGLDRAVSTELVLSNILGLGSLRLQDDLLDDEIGQGDRADATALSAVLYAAAVDIYRCQLSARSRFWAELELRMAEWRAASSEAESVRLDAGGTAQLAARGAPLKLCAFAVCELAGRLDLLPAIESCLDETLSAMVLYDHAMDWQADLDAGRWNAFVAAWAEGPARSQDLDRTRANVYVAMMARGAVSRYFGQIHAAYARAIDVAATLAIPELTDYLRSQVANIDGQGKCLEWRYSELGNQAAAPMLAGSRAG